VLHVIDAALVAAPTATGVTPAATTTAVVSRLNTVSLLIEIPLP